MIKCCCLQLHIGPAVPVVVQVPMVELSQGMHQGNMTQIPVDTNFTMVIRLGPVIGMKPFQLTLIVKHPIIFRDQHAPKQQVNLLVS